MNRKFEFFLAALAGCAVAASGTSPAGAITTAPTWLPRESIVIGISDTAEHTAQDRILAYDHHGNPGIAFFDEVDNTLRFARRLPGVGWVHGVADDGGGTNNVGGYPSLAFDRYERPAISYRDFTGSALKYAHLEGSDWQVESVDTGSGIGYYTSLAFDNLGQAAVAYQDLSDSSLRYIRDTDGDGSLVDETPVVVVNDFLEGNYASLVFDPLNRPMIAHFDTTNDDLRFSVEDPGIGWVTTTVDSAGSTGWFPSIDIDPDTGNPAIAYHESTPEFRLRFAEWNGTSWDLTTIDEVGNTGFSPSLAFDPADGNPAISYQNVTAGTLRLAWHDGVSWLTQTVDAVGAVGNNSSLAFNDFGSGFPSIAYMEDGGPGTDNIYFIEDPLPLPEPTTLWLLACGAVLIAARRKWASTTGGAARKSDSPYTYDPSL